MSYTTRNLPPAEYPRLVGTALDGVWQYLPPTAIVGVVEDEAGAIVGAWSAFPVWHLEGVWIAPAHRGKTTVARRLLAWMRGTLRGLGVGRALTGAMTDDVRAILGKLGAVQLPGDHFVVSVRGE